MKQCIDVPLGWQRLIKSESVVYITPSKSELKSKEDVFVYLTSPGTCKCGLKCPLHLDSLFSFDLNTKSKNLLKVQTQNGQNDGYKSLQNRSKENEHVKIETSVQPVKHSCGLDLVINGNDTSIKAIKSNPATEKEYLTSNNLRTHHPNGPADAVSYDDLKSPSPAIKNRPKNQAQTVRSPYHIEPLPSMSVFCKINQTSVEDILNSFTRRNHQLAPTPTIQMEVDTPSPEKMQSNKPLLVTNPPKDNKSIAKSSPTTQGHENYSPMMYNTSQMSHLERQHQAQLEYMMQYQMYQQYRLNNNKGKASSESYGDNMTIQSMYHSQRQAEFMRMHQKMQQQTNAQQNNSNHNPSHTQRSGNPANAPTTKPTNPARQTSNPSTSAAPPPGLSTDTKQAQHPRSRQNNPPEIRVQQNNSRTQQKHQPELNSQSRPVYDLKNQIQFTVPSFNQGHPAGASGYQYQGVLKPHAFMQQSENQERTKNPPSKSKNPKYRPPSNSKIPSKHPPDQPRNVVDPSRAVQDPNNPNNKPMLVISTNQDNEPPKKSAKTTQKKVMSSENCLTSVDSILKTCSNLNIGSFKDIDKDPGKKPDPKQHQTLPTPTEGAIHNIISTPKSQVQQNVANIAPAYGIVRMQYLTPVHQVSVLPSNVVSLPVVQNPPKAEEPEKWEGVLSPSEVDAKVQKMLSSPQKIEDHHVVSHEKDSDPKKRKRQQSAPHMYDRYPGNPSLRFQTTGSQKSSKSSSKSEGSDLSPVFRPVVKPNWPQFVQQAPTVSSSTQFIPVSQAQVIINPAVEDKGVRKIHPKL